MPDDHDDEAERDGDAVRGRHRRQAEGDDGHQTDRVAAQALSRLVWLAFGWGVGSGVMGGHGALLWLEVIH